VVENEVSFQNEKGKKGGERTRSQPNEGVLTRCCLPCAAIELSVSMSSSSSVMSWEGRRLSVKQRR
jgi:hypothetical protein